MGDWPEARSLQLAMQNVMNYCKVMMDAGNIILDYTSKRPAPVVYWFFGQGGIGKSTIPPYLMKASVDKYPTRRPYRHGKDLYSYNSSQKYWNGFSGQLLFVASESWQIVMDEARASAMETWFRHAEESSWTVDKADVNSKGTCFFECDKNAEFMVYAMDGSAHFELPNQLNSDLPVVRCRYQSTPLKSLYSGVAVAKYVHADKPDADMMAQLLAAKEKNDDWEKLFQNTQLSYQEAITTSKHRLDEEREAHAKEQCTIN